MTTTGEDDVKRWAFRVQPQTEQRNAAWQASYPGTDWSVSAPTEDEARQRLQEEVERRRAAGKDPFAAIYRRHLRETIPDVYAMDNALYHEVARKSGYDQNALQQAFEEAERRRALGKPYTKVEYQAEHPDG
ncbi:hypothetical protein MLM_1470 [Mycobacterium lepraemurium]|nr:hypothetical protein [Mycobacterium lepraemurium]ATA28110.1 hypothetical protein MLM_1470 [Mycobacterium lepraemurium]